MNFSGFQLKGVIDRFSGICEWDDVTELPLGVSEVVQNMRFNEQSIASRLGLARAFVTGQASPITGAALLKYTGNEASDVPEKFALLYDGTGHCWRESPAGSGTLVPVVSSLLKTGNYAGRMCCAYDRCYLPQGNLIEGKASPLVFSGRNKNLQQMSFRPWGLEWEKATEFHVGAIVSPITENGRVYRCEVAGTSGAVEPVWPTGDAATVGDNGITWQECTPWMGITAPVPAMPAIARVGAGGTFPAGRDVYIKTTLKNGLGETDIATQPAAMLASTVLNDAVRVNVPVPGAWAAGLIAPYAITNWEVYEADVAHGAAAPASSAFKFAGTFPIATAQVDVTAAATGAVGPTANTAYLAGVGNICSGIRWMAVLAELESGYVVGIADPMPISMDAGDNGRSVLVKKIPLGPANTKRRICSFTAAGDSRGGRYFYIPEDDKLYPGDTQLGAFVAITKTVIEDNVTTSAIFNFPDVYLNQMPTEVTEYFNKSEIPPCSDIYFSKALNRLIFTGVKGFPSGHLVSDEADPETVRIVDGGSELEVAEKDGDKTVTWREVGTVQYSLKENSGHEIIPSDANPAKWGAKQAWTGSGPCGPLAVDGTDKFLVYWHTSGPYLMPNDAPVFIGAELTKIIARVNRGAKQTIWTHIDQEAHEISFGLPLDGATKPNYRLRLKVREWSQLNSEPVTLTRNGSLVANTFGRKWSLDPMNVNLMLTMDRDLMVPVNAQVDHRQVLYCSGNNDGLVRYENPVLLHDEDAAGNPVAILWKNRGVLFGKDSAILGLGGVTVSAKGAGLLQVTAISHGDDIDLTEKRPCVLDAAHDTHFDLPARTAYDEHFGLSFEGDGAVDSWVELHEATMHLKQAWATRRG